MISEKQRVLRWFYRQVFPPGTIEFDDLLAQAVNAVLGKSSMDTDAYVHSNKTRLWNALLERLDIDKRLGRAPLFIVRDPTSHRLSWFPRCYSHLQSTREKHMAVKLSARPCIARMTDRLTDRQYEALACSICELMGATHVMLTPASSEGGIDFFATIKVPARCHVFGGNRNPFRIIGQAKKHSDRVNVGWIKEFITTIQEVKGQTPSVERLVPAWFRTASGPVVGWFIAHNGVQSGGVTKARNHGIIVSDTLDLAEIAALSRQLDPAQPPDQRSRNLLARLDQLL